MIFLLNIFAAQAAQLPVVIDCTPRTFDESEEFCLSQGKIVAPFTSAEDVNTISELPCAAYIDGKWHNDPIATSWDGWFPTDGLEKLGVICANEFEVRRRLQDAEVEDFVLAVSHDSGVASFCDNIGCNTLRGGLAECRHLCWADPKCNVFNFCPKGATCTSGVNRCCRRHCASTTESGLQLDGTHRGWDVYTRLSNVQDEINYDCDMKRKFAADVNLDEPFVISFDAKTDKDFEQRGNGGAVFWWQDKYGSKLSLHHRDNHWLFGARSAAVGWIMQPYYGSETLVRTPAAIGVSYHISIEWTGKELVVTVDGVEIARKESTSGFGQVHGERRFCSGFGSEIHEWKGTVRNMKLPLPHGTNLDCDMKRHKFAADVNLDEPFVISLDARTDKDFEQRDNGGAVFWWRDEYGSRLSLHHRDNHWLFGARSAAAGWIMRPNYESETLVRAPATLGVSYHIYIEWTGKEIVVAVDGVEIARKESTSGFGQAHNEASFCSGLGARIREWKGTVRNMKLPHHDEFSSKMRMTTNGWVFKDYSFENSFIQKETEERQRYCSDVPETSYCGFMPFGDVLSVTMNSPDTVDISYGNSQRDAQSFVAVTLNGGVVSRQKGYGTSTVSIVVERNDVIGFYTRFGVVNIHSLKRRERKEATEETEEWTIIDENAACERNNEGIERTFGASGFTLETCKARCIETVGCAAIDFYRDSGWCNLFDTACAIPLSTHHGAGSWTRSISNEQSSFSFSLQVARKNRINKVQIDDGLTTRSHELSDKETQFITFGRFVQFTFLPTSDAQSKKHFPEVIFRSKHETEITSPDIWRDLGCDYEWEQQGCKDTRDGVLVDTRAKNYQVKFSE